MATTIVKTTYTFTVLHRGDEPLSDIEHALAESDTGHAVGWQTASETVDVPDSAVPEELRKLGNDGEFFEDDLHDDDPDSADDE